MKALFIFASIALCLFAAAPQVQAQTVRPNSYVGKLTGTAVDTVTNTGADTLYLSVPGPWYNVTFQYNIIKISGTVGGTIKVYGSIDGGTKYASTALNSYTVTDATAQGSYAITGSPYLKYMVIITGTGTMSASYEIWALYH